jgi:murein DD-endopeptidase MepM/ murein hydrolase activator NlpD
MKPGSRNVLMFTALSVVLTCSAVVEAGRIIWPCTGSVTSPYGPRSSPCSGCSTFHHGIDIGVGTGTDLGSPGNGTVTSYAFDSCGGNIFKIGYGGGWETRFLHCSARVANVGAAVTRNQHVAESGGTGSCTTGPHLHFEVRKDGASQSIPGSSGTWVTRNTEVPQVSRIERCSTSSACHYGAGLRRSLQ